MSKTALLPGFDLGTVVRTPLKRVAEVVGALPDGRLDLIYVDDHDRVALLPGLVRPLYDRRRPDHSFGILPTGGNEDD